MWNVLFYFDSIKYVLGTFIKWKRNPFPIELQQLAQFATLPALIRIIVFTMKRLITLHCWIFVTEIVVYVVSDTCTTNFDGLTLSTEKHRFICAGWNKLYAEKGLTETIANIVVVAKVDRKDSKNQRKIGQETKTKNDHVSSGNRAHNPRGFTNKKVFLVIESRS